MADPVAGQSALLTPNPSVAAASSDPSLAAPASTVATDPSTAAAPSWFEGLPDGLRSNPTVQNFKGKDIKDVVESFVNAEKLVGGSLRLPTDKDTPAEKAAKLEKVYTQLGRPEKPDGYKLTPPAEDSGIPWDAAKAEEFKAVAHKLGLTQAQVEGLAAYDTQRAMATQVDTTKAYQDCMQTLEQDWGAASKTMLGLSRRTAATYFAPETLQLMDKVGLTNNPAFIKSIAMMGKELMEEGLIVGGREGMTEDGGVTALQAEYNKIMNDDKHAYWNAGDPNHAAAVTRMEQLQRALLELAPTAR